MALIASFAYLIPPMALNKITDYIDTYDKDAAGDGVPLIVVASVAGLCLGQVRYPGPAVRMAPPELEYDL